MTDWLVVGISGVTCSGKTTLADRIYSNLHNSMIMRQDNYFLPTNDPRHIQIQELNHINWEILTSLDMTRMHADVLKIINSQSEDNTNSDEPIKVKILILEGFLIFNYKPISDLCDLKYFLTLTKQQCWNRRKVRTYEPPDVPGYFERIVWPEYVRHKSEILKDEKLSATITFLDGSQPKEDLFEKVFSEIKARLN